jgi:hypothetical protein
MKATTHLSTDPAHREEKKGKICCSEPGGGANSAKWQKITRCDGSRNHGCGPQVNRLLGEELLSVWYGSSVRGETVRKDAPQLPFLSSLQLSDWNGRSLENTSTEAPAKRAGIFLFLFHFHSHFHLPTSSSALSPVLYVQSSLHSAIPTYNTSPGASGSERPLGAPQPDLRTAIRIISVSSFPPRQSDLLQSSYNPGFERRQTKFEENIGRVFSHFPSSVACRSCCSLTCFDPSPF